MKKVLLILFLFLSFSVFSQKVNFQYDLINKEFIYDDDGFVIDTGNAIDYIAGIEDSIIKYEDSIIIAGVGDVLHFDAASSDTSSLTYNSTAITVSSVLGDVITLSGSTGMLNGLHCRFGSAVSGQVYTVLNVSGNDITVTPTPSGVVATQEIFRGCESSFTDLSPYKNNGTQATAAYQPAALWLGTDTSAYNFDGVDDYITIADNPVFTPVNGSISISAWVFLKTNLQTSMFICKSEGTNRQFNLYINLGKIRFWAGKNNNIYCESPLAYSSGSWYHIVGVFNTTSNKGLLYVNGNLVDSKNTWTYKMDDGTSNVYIGRWAESATAFINGSIDEPKIFNRVLSPTEILQLYENGKHK